jgi:SEC-C motif-containing protein
MAKIGRNDPCPCGSGKKHKRCCLSAQAPTPDPASTVMTADANVEEHDDLCDCCLDALNERADRTLDLLLDGNLDEAEAMAHDLMRDFPDEVEGIDLLSMVSEARGERERTVGLLRRAIEIVRVHPFHDAETRLLMHQRLRQLEQRP